MMRLAVHWADLHLADPEFAEACFTSPKTFAGEGSPAIDEFCVPEFATMLGRTNDSAGRFLTDCVEVAYRLPRLWAAVQAGLVAGWRARLIAQTTLALTLEAATYVDEQVFWCASRLTPVGVGSAGRRGPGPVHARRGRAGTGEVGRQAARHLRHPAGLLRRHHGAGGQPRAPRRPRARRGGEVRVPSTSPSSGPPTPSTDAGPPRSVTWPGTSSPSASTTRTPAMVEEGRSPVSKPAPAAKPVTQVVLYAHLSADALTHPDPTAGASGAGEALCARVEQAGQRLLSVEQIRAWCGRPDVAVTVNPVIDLRERLECLGYEPTAKIREHVIVRDGTCVFPWCGRNARRCDVDHIVPYDHDHPDQGGPTSTDNLAAAVPPAPPVEDPRPVALRDDRPRRLHLDQPAGLHLPARPHRQPRHRQGLARARHAPHTRPTE